MHALVMHAVVVAGISGALFTVGVWTGGRALFTSMGGQGDALANALLYANVLFLGAIPSWIANLLAAALRGASEVRVPAMVTAGGALLTLALSPLFIFGWVPARNGGGRRRTRAHPSRRGLFAGARHLHALVAQPHPAPAGTASTAA